MLNSHLFHASFGATYILLLSMSIDTFSSRLRKFLTETVIESFSKLEIPLYRRTCRSPRPVYLLNGFFFAGQSDILSAAGSLAHVFPFVVHAEFQVGFVAPVEFV